MPTSTKQTRVLLAFIIVNLLVLTAFIYQHYFLAGRYVIFLSLILLLWVPFALDKLYQSWRAGAPGFLSKTWVFPLICLGLLSYSFVSIVETGYSKSYITYAGQWVDKNSAADAKVYSNNLQLAYYTHRDTNNLYHKKHEITVPELLTSGNWKNYDVLVLRLKKNEKSLQQVVETTTGLDVVKQFKNKRGDSVLIFQVTKPS